MSDTSPRAVYVSILSNFAVAATKFAVAAAAGSTALLAEGVHSLVDACDGLLLLLGVHRAARPPDRSHQFGHGREVYFWSFVVAVLFFAFGSALTIEQGVRQWLHPRPLSHPGWAYFVLGAAALFEGTSFLVAYRQLRRGARGKRTWLVIHESKNPPLFSIVLEDFADLIGLALAFLGILLGQIFDMPGLDGLAAIAIGVLLGVVAVVLLVETHGLLIGEAASSHFDHSLRPNDVATVVDLIERRIRREHPEVRHVYLQSGDDAELR